MKFKNMKVAILGAGCYRTHAGAGITNFARACEVAEKTGKPKIAMTHSSITMGAELMELAGIKNIVISDPVFNNDFKVINDFDYKAVMEAHKKNPESIMPQIRKKVAEVAKDVPNPPKGAIHFVHPKDLGFKIATDDKEAVSDADWVMTWLPKGKLQKEIIGKFIDYVPEGAILTHACTTPTTKLKKTLSDLNKSNINISSYHPGAVPEMKGQVYISEGYASQESIDTLFEIGKIARGNAFKLPAELLGPVCDMSSAFTAITYSGLLSYRDAVVNVIGAPPDFAQSMAKESLEQMIALMDKVGIDKMEKSLNPGALLETADSMNLGALTNVLPTVLEDLKRRAKK